MASYYDDYLKQNKKIIEDQKNALLGTKNASDTVALEKLNADNAALESTYGTQIADTKQSYGDLIRRNETQKVLNERAVERRMAEMGLTDSGLNRTQATAVQLSHANRMGDLMTAQQKAVDTLAASMQSAKAQNQLAYNATLAKNKADYNQGLADIDALYSANANEYAAKMKQADADAEAARVKAVKDSYNNLYDILSSDKVTDPIKQSAVLNYAQNYGFASAFEAKSLLDSVGFSGQYTLKELPDGTLEIEFADNIAQPNYSSYAPSVTIQKTNDTKNGFLGIKGLFGGIDNNDEYLFVDNNTGAKVSVNDIKDEFKDIMTRAQLRKLSDLKQNDTLSVTDLFDNDPYKIKLFSDWLKLKVALGD